MAAGFAALIGSIWAPILLVYFFIWGIPCIVAAIYFAVLRADVVLSKKTCTLELRPKMPIFQSRRTLRLPFAGIREFLVESEFELVPDSPFVWHLTAITTDGKHFRLTWHFARDPVYAAGQQASQITGKPLREERDPWQSSTWRRWGYNLLG